MKPSEFFSKPMVRAQAIQKSPLATCYPKAGGGSIDSRGKSRQVPLQGLDTAPTPRARFWRRTNRLQRQTSRIGLCALFIATAWSAAAATVQSDGADRYREEILPILEDRCYDCHGDGSSKGSMALDEFADDADLLGRHDLWLSVVKNIRARIMPPERKPQLTDEEKARINDWIQKDVFGIDQTNPDPGRATIRRLNRAEYRNTIRDLMGVDFNTELEFPPDDTGYGFDNIGDVLSVSPMLLEKYVRAAETIVEEAVPKSSKVRPEFEVAGNAFRSKDGKQTGDRISFYDAALLLSAVHLEHSGRYELEFTVHVDGEFAFDPGRCLGIFSLDGKELARDEFVYAFSDDPDRGATFHYKAERDLEAGEHLLTIEVRPLVPVDEKLNRLDFRVKSAVARGPADPRYGVQPHGYTRFFPEGPAPEEIDAQWSYAERILREFGRRAFRRPLSESTLKDLIRFAAVTFEKPDRSFEEGIARSMVVVLASPRFLFRLEADDPHHSNEQHPLVDEWSLASRLSYFFWSSMPDEELFALAAEGKLRERLPSQIARMLKDPRSDALVRNFTGQWLQARNIDHIPIEPLAALGHQKEMDEIQEKFGNRLFRRREEGEDSPELQAARERSGELWKISGSFNAELRDAMRRETEMMFEHVLRENRSVSEFLNSDYTFLNQQLAEHYGIDGVEGDEMRFVQLPPGSPRGGVLTQGNMLLVTSNPTRTSPVKRGLFILENILGTPTPPPPADVPELEAAAEEISDHEPTIRELLARHREDSLCSSCHSRIDPLGLAFENFTALGTWRDEEAGQVIDPAGDLITGESFTGVQELKAVLADKHQSSFHRCLTEKLLTYALGRGLEYYDEYTVDQIVNRLEQHDGQFLALIEGIVESAPFQKRRRTEPKALTSTAEPDPHAQIARATN